MITSMRGCVAYNELWPWPISRSFGIGLENCVRSVASTVPDGFFPYLVQMITSMRRCVTCDDLWPWHISSRSFNPVLAWDPTWLNSVGNHEAAGGILRTQAFVLVVLVITIYYIGQYLYYQYQVHFHCRCRDMSSVGLNWQWVKPGSDNGSVPSGKKIFLEILTKCKSAIWHT